MPSCSSCCLTDPARQALIERGGPWRDILALAEALERHDLTSAGELADAFGGLDRVLTLSDEAWGWAASVQRELDASGTAGFLARLSRPRRPWHR